MAAVRRLTFVMGALCNRAGHYIFVLWFLLLSSFYLSIFLLISSPNVSRSRLDVYHTSAHGVTSVRIQDAGLKLTARGYLKIRDAKSRQKIAIWASSHNFVGLYLRNWGTCWQSEKPVKQQYLLHMCLHYGELRPTSGWDRSRSLGHPANFSGFRILAALLHGTLVVGVSQTLRPWTEGATIFGRVAIMLGIGPHSSCKCIWDVHT